MYLVEGSLVAVKVRISPEFTIQEPEPLFAFGPVEAEPNASWRYAVAADSQRILVLKDTGTPTTPSIHIVQNWFEEFRDREQD